MNREELLEQIRRIVHECAPEMDVSVLTEDSVINTDTAIDSMGFILVVCKLEAFFGIKIPERQWKKLLTMGDVADAIEKQLEKK